MDGMGNAHRAFWMFLFYTLIGPFFGAFVVALALVIGPAAGLGPHPPSPAPPIGLAVLSAYVWSAIPSALAAVILLPMVLRRGRFGWLEAAIAGVVGFAAAGQLFPIPNQNLLPYFAMLAGVVSIAARAVLERARVLAEPSEH
jgi:uncharacterized membrane protein YeaQ/YmgE (transglycosylase-associated protein family)